MDKLPEPMGEIDYYGRDTRDLDWTMEMANDGDAEAMYQMGEWHLHGGNGCVAKDPAVAAAWYSRAAEKGHARAQKELDYLKESNSSLFDEDGNVKQKNCTFTEKEHFFRPRDKGEPEGPIG